MELGHDRTTTPILDKLNTPEDLRALPEADLARLAAELRQETIDAVSMTGGHLGAGLGVVELTVALHYLFDTPRDRLIWDVSHQAYPHKILTGRRSEFERCVSQAACRASPGASKANTTRSERRTPPPRSPPASAWPWRAILPGRRQPGHLRHRRWRHERRHGL